VRYIFLSVGVLGLLAGWLGLVAKTSATDIQIVDAWVHETAEPRAVLHLRITSAGAKGDRLVRVSTSLAAKTAIFNQLGQKAEDLVIPAGSEWVMGADSPRIELIGLTRPLKAPETFDLLLGFERAGKVNLNVRVETPGAGQRAAR
jgi:periplasmic copper chaperone A